MSYWPIFAVPYHCLGHAQAIVSDACRRFLTAKGRCADVGQDVRGSCERAEIYGGVEQDLEGK